MLMTENDKDTMMQTDSSIKFSCSNLFTLESTEVPTFLKKKTKKWNRHEDIKLSEYISSYGENWVKIKSLMPGKSENEIRQRYLTHFNPSLNKEKFTKEEDERIISLQYVHGNKWTLIAKSFPNRNANMIKNRYHSKLKYINKEMIGQDINMSNTNNDSNNNTSNSTNSHEMSSNDICNEKQEYYLKNKIFDLDFNESANTFGDTSSNDNTVDSFNDKIADKINNMLALIYKVKSELNQQTSISNNATNLTNAINITNSNALVLEDDNNDFYSNDKDASLFKEYDAFI